MYTEGKHVYVLRGSNVATSIIGKEINKLNKQTAKYNNNKKKI